jgi:diaminopimelate epimerase
LALTPELVSALCDRRRGIGADGVLRVIRSAKHPEAADHSATAEWFMDYWNADGSCAEMCGNGVRVFTRHLLTAGLAEPVDGGIPIATRSGVVRALVDGDTIAVDLGRPRVYDRGAATLGPLTFPGTAVDCGNPHLVCPVSAGIELADLDLTRSPDFDAVAFPTGVNVEFTAPGAPVDGTDLHVRMRVYERGSAETMSCGSGACAVAAVALHDAGLDAGVVAVDVPGGRLTVTIDADSGWLAGPAVLVAHGEVDPAAFPG